MGIRVFGPVDTNWTDKRRAAEHTNTSSVSSATNYEDDASLETRLLAVGYTQSQLNIMTINDKVYALRLADDAAGV